MDKKNKNSTTIDQDEINHFSKDSSKWWDENGPFKPLHNLNPVRMDYIKTQVCDYYSLDSFDPLPLENLSILDIGCGGGLVCEALARMGAQTIGIDADKNAVKAAQKHAEQSELEITYICDEAKNIDKKYDVVLALEIIEHVSDITQFIQDCVARLKPDGLLIMSTLNRTPKSYALGIIAAEYILRWVPRGTHTWNKFVKPSEIAKYARKHHLAPHDITGLIYNPLKNEYQLSKTDIDVNYLISLSSKS